MHMRMHIDDIPAPGWNMSVACTQGDSNLKNVHFGPMGYYSCYHTAYLA
jgi:hypothetical protein